MERLRRWRGPAAAGLDLAVAGGGRDLPSLLSGRVPLDRTHGDVSEAPPGLGLLHDGVLVARAHTKGEDVRVQISRVATRLARGHLSAGGLHDVTTGQELEGSGHGRDIAPVDGSDERRRAHDGCRS